MYVNWNPDEWENMKKERITKERIEIAIKISSQWPEDEKKRLFGFLYSKDPELVQLCKIIVNQKLKDDKTGNNNKAPK